MRDFVYQNIMNSVNFVPKIEGPIPVTDDSYPFCAMIHSPAKLDLSDFGFVEEEYFVVGLANVYDNTAGEIDIYKGNLPYRTRIIVRRPADESKSSGRLFIDILNASNGYDIEDQWKRSYNYFLENNHLYMGITSKPINIQALKYFDFNRYKTLNWSNCVSVNQPSVTDKFHNIEGTEEGLIWDMISQIATLMRQDSSKVFANAKVDSIYLTGTSQSGIYLNTYVNHFDKYLYYKDKPLFDGYMSLVSGGIQKKLRQSENNKRPFNITDTIEEDVKVPFITLNTEGDYPLFSSIGYFERSANSNTEENKRRYYEVAGSPHTDVASLIAPSNDDIIKSKRNPRKLKHEYEYILNDFPLEYYISALLDKLHIWATEGIAPEIVEPLQFDENGELKRDEHGNALHGMRSPFLDVPKARYIGAMGEGITHGKMEFFSESKMNELYGSFDNYLIKFEKSAREQLERGFINETDFHKMLHWAKNVNS